MSDSSNNGDGSQSDPSSGDGSQSDPPSSPEVQQRNPNPVAPEQPTGGCFMNWLHHLAQSVTLMFGGTTTRADDEPGALLPAGNNDDGPQIDFPAALRNHRQVRGRYRDAVLNLLGISDSANSATIGIVAVLLGCIASVKIYQASLPFTMFLFGISVFATSIACLLAYAAIPPIVRSMDDYSVLDGELDLEVQRTSDMIRERRGRGLLSLEMQNSYKAMIDSILAERVLPSRLVQRKILVVLIYLFGVASTACVIFNRYFAATTPAHGPASPPSQ